MTGFIEKPPGPNFETNLINAGYYVMEPSTLDRIANDRPVSVETEIFPKMAEDKKLYAVPSENYWIDAGTPEDILEASNLIYNLEKKKKSYYGYIEIIAYKKGYINLKKFRLLIDSYGNNQYGSYLFNYLKNYL